VLSLLPYSPMIHCWRMPRPILPSRYSHCKWRNI